MQVIHKIDPFLLTIFPEITTLDDLDLIISTLKRYYTYQDHIPVVTLEKDFVYIDVDVPKILSEKADFATIVGLCEKGQFTVAKPLLNSLLTRNPRNSEYHRIMGQILSEEGDQEEAINCLIDALRWDSKNGWALLMMGNIFVKYKNDPATGMKYYDQALIANPEDNITINNIGANLMQQGNPEEAKKYFYEAIKINEQYPNTHFALGMIAEMEKDLPSAFYSTIQAIRFNKNKDVLYQNSVKQSFALARRIVDTEIGKKIYREYRKRLESEGDRTVDIVQDEEIPTAAKLELAENYNRKTHIVRYKPSYPAVEHLVMHELVHLDFINLARKGRLNQLFISDQEQKAKFINSLAPTIKKLNRLGVPDGSIQDYCSNLFQGLNSQIFNTPIDLFIENFLYNEYSDLRPFQFISLYTLLQEGIKAVTDKKIVDLSPKDIISKSKVYNLVTAMQFKELFGFDFIKEFGATPSELKLATEFYDEYVQYREDKEPAEEYELVLHWAEDLKLDNNFELVDELEYRTKRVDIENLLTSIEKDPYEIESKDPYKEREMGKFQKSEDQIGLNMAVVMFMVDALQYFKSMPLDQIKKIAFEIAMLGTQGYRPDKSDYKISSIAGKVFSGYHILAYYYVSWMLAIPDMVSQLNLPYQEEFEMANKMHSSK